LPSDLEWAVPLEVQPQPEDFKYDLNRALSSVVGLRSNIPADGFTAKTLGTERAGNGVIIRDGIILTIGYLITEADSIWITLIDGQVVQGHPIGYDQESGFGLVQALARLDVPALPLGSSAAARIGHHVVVGGAGGRPHSVAARIVAKQEFAGYWEYVVDEAIFTAPAHPFWGGSAVIGPDGSLIGIGSLQLQQSRDDESSGQLNMIVPIDLLKPILDDMLTLGRPNRPPRPWLGLYAAELEDKIVVAGLANDGPAEKADLRTGDIVVGVGDSRISDLAELFRSIWARGQAGTEIPLTVNRDGRTFEIKVLSTDRRRFLKGPSLH